MRSFLERNVKKVKFHPTIEPKNKKVKKRRKFFGRNLDRNRRPPPDSNFPNRRYNMFDG